MNMATADPTVRLYIQQAGCTHHLPHTSETCQPHVLGSLHMAVLHQYCWFWGRFTCKHHCAGDKSFSILASVGCSGIQGMQHHIASA